MTIIYYKNKRIIIKKGDPRNKKKTFLLGYLQQVYTVNSIILVHVSGCSLSLRSVAIINLCHKKTANLNNRPPPPRKSPSPRPQQLTWTWEGQQQQGRSTHEHRRRSGRRRVKLHYIDIIINSKDTLISKECPQGQGPSVVQLANGASSTHTLTRE